jgi:hypothetical protein
MVYKASSKQFRWTLYVEIFVRPMWYKGCHQAHNAKVVICAFFATPNSLKLQERPHERKSVDLFDYFVGCKK